MTEQEQLAREWAEKIKKKARRSPSWFDEECIAAADLVLANTKPATMADVQWDAREHRGLGTFGEDGAEWIMVDMRPDRRIVGISPDFRKARGLRPEWLTPNGKRYELREAGDDQLERPKVLCTVKDYENAPDGTVVAIQGFHTIWVKDGGRWHGAMDGSWPSTSMEDTDRQVLRWGWNG